MAETRKRLDERTQGRIPVAQYFASSSTGNDSYAITLSPAHTAYEVGREYIFKADVANTGSASLNVDGLGAKTLVKNSSTPLSNGDIPAGAIIHAVYDGTNMQITGGIVTNTPKFGGDATDGAVDGSANITITGSNNTYITKNYSSWASASGGGKTFTVTPTNCVLHIKIKGDADFTDWTFNLNNKGGLGGAGGSGGAVPTNGSSGEVGKSYTSNTGTGTGGAAGQYVASVTTLTSAGGVSGEPSGYVSLPDAISAGKVVFVAPGGGGSGGGGGYSPTDNASGGAGGTGGGCLFIEVLGNVIFSGTTINATGSVGGTGGNSSSTNNTGGGGGGGGGGGSVVILYGGSITGSCTPSVTGGAGGAGGTRGAASGGTTSCNGAGGAGAGSAYGKGSNGLTTSNASNTNTGGSGANGYYYIGKNLMFS